MARLVLTNSNKESGRARGSLRTRRTKSVLTSKEVMGKRETKDWLKKNPWAVLIKSKKHSKEMQEKMFKLGMAWNHDRNGEIFTIPCKNDMIIHGHEFFRKGKLAWCMLDTFMEDRHGTHTMPLFSDVPERLELTEAGEISLNQKDVICVSTKK